jgi:hypothetical protein
MNPVLQQMHLHFSAGKPVALMRYADGTAFLADRAGCIVRPRGVRGLNRKHVDAALASGELTEYSTPLAAELRGRGVGTWRVM